MGRNRERREAITSSITPPVSYRRPASLAEWGERMERGGVRTAFFLIKKISTPGSTEKERKRGEGHEEKEE